MTPHLLLDIVVPATNAAEAQEAALAHVAARPGMKLVRITRVRPDHDGEWAVEIAYAKVEPGFGL